MTAKGLQIGNYVQDEQGRIITVSKLHKSGLDIDRINDDSDTYQPIPLDEEWLKILKVDKEIIIGSDFYNIGPHPFYDENYENEEFSFMFSMNNENLKRVDFVHQLQNLYFALTGEQLTVGL